MHYMVFYENLMVVDIVSYSELETDNQTIISIKVKKLCDNISSYRWKKIMFLLIKKIKIKHFFANTSIAHLYFSDQIGPYVLNEETN